MDWYIECGGAYNINNQKVFGRKIFVSPKDVASIAKNKFNNIDAYSTNYIYNNEDQNKSDLLGPMYIDLDGEIYDSESYNKVKQDALIVLSYLKTHLKVPKDFVRIYFSGNKGFHIIIPHIVFGIQPCQDLNAKYKIIALELNKHTINKTVDTRIYDKKRLIRLPHTINAKSGLYKVPMTEEILRASTYQSMRLYANSDKNINVVEAMLVNESRQAFHDMTKIKPKIRKERDNTSFVNPNFEIPPCIKYIYANGAMEGGRNNTLIILSSALLQKGLELEECIDKMHEWNEDKNEPALEHSEVELTVRSAYKNLVDGRRYGCASISEIGACVGEHCKLYNK